MLLELAYRRSAGYGPRILAGLPGSFQTPGNLLRIGFYRRVVRARAHSFYSSHGCQAVEDLPRVESSFADRGSWIVFPGERESG